MSPRSASHPEAASSHDEWASDRAWVARVRAGDGGAFRAMFAQYASELADFVYRHVGVRADAEDVVQTLFTNLWLGRERWHLRGSLSAYLFLAARNLLYNRKRHDRIVDRWRAHGIAQARIGPATHPGADAEFEATETAVAIQRALQTLPPQRRAVCTLRWLHGLSYAEIAKRLGLAERTVDRHLTLGVKEMRAKVPSLREMGM